MRLTSKALAHPVYARQNTTDLFVFDLIFVEREYHCIDSVETPSLVLDCGANVGYSSAYFLSRYPDCHVIAIEPDDDNFKLLEKNVAPYGRRCRPLKAAVWPHNEPLQFGQSSLGSGNEWGRRVERSSAPSTASVKTVDIPSLIDSSGFERISILKIDIEGSEKELFRHGAQNWLEKVDNIVIELHGEEAASAFFNAIEKEKFGVSVSGELTVCVR